MKATVVSLRILVLAVVALSLSGVSCAYFNTLYNANKRYEDGLRTPRGRDGEPSRAAILAFDETIEKCQTMIGTWPNSRHVDDAMLLIAHCLYQQDRFPEAVVQLDSLESAHPDTNLLSKVRLLKGKSLAHWGEHEEAIDVLGDYIERWKKAKDRPQALYYLTTSSISIGRYEDAVGYVNELEKRYAGSGYTFDAQLQSAALLADEGLYDRSRDIYESLNAQRLPLTYRYEVWMGMANVYLKTEAYDDALGALLDVETLALTPDQEPAELLQKANAYVGLDSTDAAVSTYQEITRRFARGQYAAEAHFQLGEIWEATDSLRLAKSAFESVARAYARSDRATEAIRRSGSIGKLLRLEATSSNDSPEAIALRQFTLAELQLTQFEQPEKALDTYRALLADYPDSEYGPRAAYAVGYIYGLVLGDTLQARAAYDTLLARYPDTQQARFAYRFVTAMKSPAPGLDPVTPETLLLTDSLLAPADTSATTVEEE